MSWKSHVNPQLLKQKFSFLLKRGASSHETTVSCRGGKRSHGDASGGLGSPCTLPEIGTCKPRRAPAASVQEQRGTAGCDGRPSGCHPRINRCTRSFAPPLGDHPIYYFDEPSVVKEQNHICLLGPVPHSSTPFSSPQHLKEIFGAEVSTRAFNTNNF